MNKRTIVLMACLTAGLLMTVSALQAEPDRERPTEPKEVSLTGKVVDLHCYMTGRYPSDDRVKCTRECLRAGVPAGLETEKGLVVLGHGAKSPARLLDGLAFQMIEVKGRLYEKNGVRYLDVMAARPTAPEKPVEEPVLEEEDYPDDEPEPVEDEPEEDDPGTDGWEDS